MNSKNLIFILSIIAVLGCSNTQNDLHFEQKVFYEVVPKIIDNQLADLKGPYMIQKKTGDSTSVWIEEISVNAVVGFKDSVSEFNGAFYAKYISNHFPGVDFRLDASSSQSVYGFDISRLEVNKNYDIRYLSDIPRPEERWNKSKEFYLLALTTFSRIQFDEHKRFGVLEFSMACGRQCASTGLVYLKNENGSWTVDGIETIMAE